MSETPSPEKVARRWFDEVWGERRAATVHEILAPDAIGHLEGGIDVVGVEPFLEFQRTIFNTFSDLQLTVQRTAENGETACVHWQATGTHDGPGLGLPPTGRYIEFSGTTWFRVVQGRVREGWDCWNQAGLMQLLSTPPPVS